MARFKAADRSWMTQKPVLAEKKRQKAARMKQYFSGWSRENAHRMRAISAKRRGLQAGSMPEDYNHERVAEIFRWSRRLTACLGIQFHVDHLVPLAAGGSHNYDNLRPIPAKWNQVKGHSTDLRIPACWAERTIET